MKLTITIEVILLCIFLAIFSIFTIDTVTVRKAELTSILSTDVQDIVEGFFEKEYNTESLQLNIENAIITCSNTTSSSVDVSILYADANYGVVDLLINVKYDQPNGRPRLLTYQRTYIKEAPSNSAMTEPYSFIRTIDKNHYKTATNAFVSAVDGGLNEDSIWRTAEYEAVLDAVFAATN